MMRLAVTTIPILPSSDFDRTEQFYARLGFVAEGRWPGEYLILCRPDGIELHFWLDRGVLPHTNTASCYVRFAEAAGARGLHEEWARHLAPESLGGLTATDYGLLEAPLTDPDGNLIRFGGAL